MIEKKDRTSLKWWFFFIVHNCIAHPLLLLGEAFDTLTFFLGGRFQLHRKMPRLFRVLREVTSIIDAFHDKTIADGDTKNLVTQKRNTWKSKA